MALGPQPPMPAISVREALTAIEDARAELSPRAHEALRAIGQALVSLAYEVNDAKRDVDSVKTDVAVLEDRPEG